MADVLFHRALHRAAPRTGRVNSAVRLDHLWFRGLAKLELYRCLIVMEGRLADLRPDVPLPDGFTARLVRSDDDLVYATFRPRHGRGECGRRLAAGQWCMAAWRGAEIVSAVWGVGRRGWIEYLELAVDLAPADVYVYDLYTVPELRQGLIASALTVTHIRYLQDQGYRRVLATLGRFNRAGAYLQARDGARPIGWIGYVGVGPWRRPFCLVSPGEKGFAVASTPGAASV
jgi:ribosomal protein S18 acetylase RimI-like enzyme